MGDVLFTIGTDDSMLRFERGDELTAQVGMVHD